MDQARHRRMFVLGQGILHHGLEGDHLPVGRDNLLAHRTAGVVGIDEAGKVGGDIDPEQAFAAERLAFGSGQVDHPLQLGDGVEPVAHLPAPIHPLLIRHILPVGGAGVNFLL
jgi:hypothetical protein